MRSVVLTLLIGLLGVGAPVAGPRAPTPNCTAHDLHVSASLLGGSAHVAGGIALKNVSGHLCLLPRWPPVAILWHGRALSLHALPWENYRPNSNQREVLLLKPRQAAFMPLLWSNWCGARPWGKFFLAPIIRLSMWSRLLLITPRPRNVAPPICLSQKQSSTLQFGRFYTPLPKGWIS